MKYKIFTANSYVKSTYEGYCALLKNLTKVPHSHDYYEIFFVLDGTTGHTLNGKKSNLIKGSLIVVRPNEVHEFDASDCQIINLILPVNFINKIADYLGLTPAIEEILFSSTLLQRDLSQKNYESLRASFEQFILAPHPDPKSYNTGLKIVVVTVFEKLLYDDSIYDKPYYPSWFQNLLIEMQKQENYAAGLKAMYEISRCTPEHLCRMFKKHLSITPTQFLANIRINEASKELIYTDIPIIEISENIGYETLSHFYHHFKARYNTSPMKYRKSNQVDLSKTR